MGHTKFSDACRPIRVMDTVRLVAGGSDDHYVTEVRPDGRIVLRWKWWDGLLIIEDPRDWYITEPAPVYVDIAE